MARSSAAIARIAEEYDTLDFTVADLATRLPLQFGVYDPEQTERSHEVTFERLRRDLVAYPTRLRLHRHQKLLFAQVAEKFTNYPT